MLIELRAKSSDLMLAMSLNSSWFPFAMSLLSKLRFTTLIFRSVEYGSLVVTDLFGTCFNWLLLKFKLCSPGVAEDEEEEDDEGDVFDRWFLGILRWW
jgi:hypothetical protein